MPKNHASPDDDQQRIQARCPSCGNVSEFQFIGVQKWPEAVARRRGIPTRMRLYQCLGCMSTISELMLQDPDQTAD